MLVLSSMFWCPGVMHVVVSCGGVMTTSNVVVVK